MSMLSYETRFATENSSTSAMACAGKSYCAMAEDGLVTSSLKHRNSPKGDERTFGREQAQAD